MRGELGDAKLTQDNEPLPLYGLLVARFRLNCTRDGEEEIRWRPWRSFARPLSFGGSIGIASECSIGMLELLEACRAALGAGLAMVGNNEYGFCAQ